MFEFLYDKCNKAVLEMKQLESEISKNNIKIRENTERSSGIMPTSIIIPMVEIVPESKEAVKITSDKIDKKKNLSEYMDAKLHEIVGSIF